MDFVHRADGTLTERFLNQSVAVEELPLRLRFRDAQSHPGQSAGLAVEIKEGRPDPLLACWNAIHAEPLRVTVGVPLSAGRRA